MKTVVRITRHPADPSRIEALRAVFGNDLQVVEDDVQYGDDPVRTVVELLAKYENVVAFEVVAPVPVLAKLTSARRELGDVLIIRAEFKRGEDGRAVVVSKDASGRDVFGFDHYEVVEKVLVQTRHLSAAE